MRKAIPQATKAPPVKEISPASQQSVSVHTEQGMLAASGFKSKPLPQNQSEHAEQGRVRSGQKPDHRRCSQFETQERKQNGRGKAEGAGLSECHIDRILMNDKGADRNLPTAANMQPYEMAYPLLLRTED